MLPYIHLGQLTISTYYSAMILGFILMIVLMLYINKRSNNSLGRAKSVFFATMVLVFGVLGCKLLFILENINWIKNNGFTFGGFSFYGAVFLVPLMMPIIGRFLKFKCSKSLDYSAICIIAMLGTIRLGCFLNGCCGGKVFSFNDYLFTFPTQFIECIIDFLILFRLLDFEKEEKKQGQLYPSFLLLYGVARFFIEFIRLTDKDWLYLSHAQWFSIGSVIVGGAILRYLHTRSRQPLPQP